MSVSAVTSYENKSPFSTVASATIAGGAVGYVSKYAIPLRKSEKEQINYRAAINASRKDVNRQKVEEFRALKSTNPAQDAFVKMIEYRNADVKEPVAKALKDFEADLKVAFKDGFDQKVLDEKIENFGNHVQTTYSNAIVKRTTDTTKGVGESLETLRDELSRLFKSGMDDQKLSAKLTNFNEQYLRSISSGKDTFATANLKEIVNSLDMDNAVKFKKIIAEVNEAAASNSRKLVEACHSVLKGKRMAAPLIATGAIAGFAAGLIHNILKTNTEA